MNDNVKSLPTAADGTQGWQCSVCKAELWYPQPINLKMMLQQLGAFLMLHDHDELKGKPKCDPQDRWIMCADNLPSDRRTVIVRDAQDLEMAAYYDGKSWCFGKPTALGVVVKWREPAGK